jgi:pimeloyl-ACP methyl ester carboxylesterase
LVLVNNQKVALIGHSQGCKFGQYFLHWIEDTIGKEWIDRNVEQFIAVGPPWVGAPKVVRALMTGDSMGLPTQVLLGDKWMVAMSRTFSSCPWLLPFGSLDHCISFKTEGAKHWREVLSKESEVYYFSNLPLTNFDLSNIFVKTFSDFMANFYDNCPYLNQPSTTEAIPRTAQAPYVATLHSIYGKFF